MNEWNDIAVIAPVSDIDISTVDTLRVRIENLLSQGVHRILLNCQEVGFIDSTGLAFLLTCARRLQRAGGMLSLVNVSDSVTRILSIARLLDVLHASGVSRRTVPALPVGTLPVWSKTMSIREGVQNLPYYRHRVVDLLSGLAMTPDARFDTALAAGEALSNAYDHAGGHGCSMTVAAYADRVVIEVTDRGCGFEIADDVDPETSDERGRGIKLMRMLLDAAEVRRRRDGDGTCVTLVKMLNKASE